MLNIYRLSHKNEHTMARSDNPLVAINELLTTSNIIVADTINLFVEVKFSILTELRGKHYAFNFLGRLGQIPIH